MSKVWFITGAVSGLGAAGSDALDAITTVVEARLAELRAHADLSRAAGGAFTPAGSAS
jgi:hypothetical protein